MPSGGRTGARGERVRAAGGCAGTKPVRARTPRSLPDRTRLPWRRSRCPSQRHGRKLAARDAACTGHRCRGARGGRRRGCHADRCPPATHTHACLPHPHGTFCWSACVRRTRHLRPPHVNVTPLNLHLCRPCWPAVQRPRVTARVLDVTHNHREAHMPYACAAHLIRSMKCKLGQMLLHSDPRSQRTPLVKPECNGG